MFEKLRQVLVALTKRADEDGSAKDVRRLQAMAAKSLRAGTIARDLQGMDEVAALFARITGAYLDRDAVARGGRGPFDACDLTIWLEIAKAAGVPAVPARLVASLDEAETALACGAIAVDQSPMTRGLAKLAAKAGLSAEGGAAGKPSQEALEAVEEKLSAAMDDVPEGWMVRSARCGGSNLKALAGCGAAGPQVPEVRFGPDLEVGPGWVRRGNRRMVDATDRRTIESHAQAPEGRPLEFLARPWIAAARWAACEDPHRHNSALAGLGLFPAEWRVFIEDGRVTGVASYYGWCGDSTPKNARVALAARALAQRIVDETARRGLAPRHTDVDLTLALAEARFAEQDAALATAGGPEGLSGEHAAYQPHHARDRHAVEEARRRFPADGVSMTLDFMEARGGPGEHGLVLLEAGPAFHPFGGGHPCAFAGMSPPTTGASVNAEGVAFKVMDHVVIAEPRTWTTAPTAEAMAGRIYSWEAVEEIAGRGGDPDAPDLDGPRTGDFRTFEQMAAPEAP